MKAATVLIIENQASVRMVLAGVLEDAGYQVCEAINGRQGLEQIHTRPVDLVITDLEMTEMNGLEVILELTCAFLDVKVIAMSGNAGGELQKAKPLDLHALLHAVQFELQHSPSSGVR
jgi:CheY-like chemotaxis protein